MAKKAVEIRNLVKDFKTDFWKPKIRAVNDVSFFVESGSVFGLIGPNGAGKTTAIKVLMGLIRPTSGETRIFDYSSSDLRAKQEVGYLPEQAYYYDYLKTEEVLDFYGRLFGLSSIEREQKVEELLKLVGLADKKGVKLRNYSKGMLQRIGIAQALVNDPSLVVMDEPMSGLDPVGRKDVRDIILRLKDQGKTILFCSHILHDVETLCDHVAIIIKGELKACGAMGEIIDPRIKTAEIIFLGNLDASLPHAWVDKVKIRQTSRETILSTKDFERVNEIVEWGKAQRLSLLSVIPHRESLEDIFVEKIRDEP